MPRSEADVFTDLATVCRSRGYIHVIAHLCFQNNIIPCGEELRPDDVRRRSSPEGLIRGEITTLIGLMVQGEMDWELPSPEVVQELIDETERLLGELHQTFLPSMTGMFGHRESDPEFNPLTQGQFLREVIFYSGESAYSFQYRDFAQRKYAADDRWMTVNRGFTIGEACEVVRAIGHIQEQKLASTMAEFLLMPPSEWTLVPGFSFKASDVADATGLGLLVVEAVLNAFTVPESEKNSQFRSISDFNVINAMPLLRGKSEFVLFQTYSLAEALYESPFYWMTADKAYVAEAMQNRGRFTEEFCRDRLEAVFGKSNVHANVNLESKERRLGEIDVLVFFGDRAIIVQAKSKRLTLESRKGNDGQIRDDFKKSVQDSCDQALLCAQAIRDGSCTPVGYDGREITVPATLSEIYVLCVVSDHYPSLNFQVRQFLASKTSPPIQSPLILDVFALDAIAEMLDSPLRTLSYLNRRAKYSDRINASHELIVLAYHLTHNLWVDGEVSMLMLNDDFSPDLDVAMAVRRDGIPGQRTPIGILTKWISTPLGRIVADIEKRPEPGIIDFGFLVLSLSQKSAVDLGEGIQRMAETARRDGQDHDLTISLDSEKGGITVHCTDVPRAVATPRLQRHCERRKYIHRAETWFGVCVHPHDASLRFGLKLDYHWESNSRMEEITRAAPRGSSLPSAFKSSEKARKVGRNEQCPCQSGLKFKKCHGR